MNQPFYNPRQREVLKPTQPFIYLDEGVMDHIGPHPVVCCAYDVDKQLAFVFHSTSRAQDDKAEIQDLLYYFADPEMDEETGKLPDIVYSNFRSTQPSFIDITHFSIVSFQDMNYSEKRYGQVSKNCLTHILIQYLFLWDNNGVLGEHLVPDDIPNRNDILDRYYFLNTKEDMEQFFKSSFGLIFPNEDIDLESVYNTLRTSDYYMELSNLYHETLFDEFTHYQFDLYNNFPNILNKNDVEDQRKLVVFENNAFIAWYPLVKCRDNPAMDARYFPLSDGSCFDEKFFSKCKFAVCLDELHTDNRDDFLENNKGLVLHMNGMKYIDNPYVGQIPDDKVPVTFKNHFITRTLYLVSERRDDLHLDYRNEKLGSEYNNDKMFWLNYVYLGINNSISPSTILNDYVSLLKTDSEYDNLIRRFGSHETNSIEILSDDVETHGRGR